MTNILTQRVMTEHLTKINSVLYCMHDCLTLSVKNSDYWKFVCFYMLLDSEKFCIWLEFYIFFADMVPFLCVADYGT